MSDADDTTELAPLSDAAPFGPVEHLLAELRRLDLLLLDALPRLRRTADDTVPAALHVVDGTALPFGSAAGRAVDDPRRALAEHVVAIRAGLSAALAAGVRLPLIELCRNWQLDDISLAVLVLAIAPHVARRYEDVFAFIQGDAALRAPQLDLAVSLFAASTAEQLALRARLSDVSPLFASGFVWLADPDPLRGTELTRAILVSPRLVRFLCDQAGAEPDVEAVRARPPLPPVTTALARELATVRDAMRAPMPAAPVAILRSDDGPSALAAAARLARDLGRPALLIDLSRPGGFRSSVEATLQAVFDEARLQAAVLAIAGYDDLAPGLRDVALAATAAQLDRFPGLVVAVTHATLELRHELGRRAVLTLTAPPPDADERAALWRSELAGRPTDADAVRAVARNFQLGASQIRDAARQVAVLDATAGPRAEHLHAAGRARSHHSLGNLAERVTPWGRWQDLVVPPASVARLRDVIDRMQHRDTVFLDWGLGQKVAVWRRITALFAGPPGTGKTLSASLIAQALGLDLFRIELASVVSKYIGDTEKNLDRLFRAAHGSNAILFFDEADALFGKRTEVKDAHDRHANLETSYLLQKLEAFEGLAILATNFKKNLDPAFLRRIDVFVDFPMPGKDERRRLWRSLLPDAMPLAADVDLDFLADRFELSGGVIMSAIQAAATRSAAAGQSLAMVPLLRGVRDELHKQGKLVGKDDLGAFARHVEATP